MTPEARIQELFELYYNGRSTPAEETELMELVAGHPGAQAQLSALLQQQWEGLTAADERFTAQTGQPVLQRILARRPGRLVPLYRLGWAAAAIILVMLTVGVIMWQQRMQQPQVAQAVTPVIPPGSNKAILTLADGSTLALDSNGRRTIQQGAATVQQQGGHLVYNAGNGNALLSYNTLRTPRGGQFRLTLPDGTAVWLNAASSITYPTAFTGAERNVSISGEVYFEVAQMAGKPFMVKVNDHTAIQVLGTQFNISAYTDEATVNTTLLQGSIKVSAAGNSRVLQPGQQAQTTGAGTLQVLDNADTDQAIAWKNGSFNFNGKDLQEVMRQLARWYDIDVVFSGQVPVRKFGGEIQRSLPLSEVLEILQQMDVKFKIKNEKTLIVLPG